MCISLTYWIEKGSASNSASVNSEGLFISGAADDNLIGKSDFSEWREEEPSMEEDQRGWWCGGPLLVIMPENYQKLQCTPLRVQCRLEAPQQQQLDGSQRDGRGREERRETRSLAGDQTRRMLCSLNPQYMIDFCSSTAGEV
jgi:hypothetical protein